MEPEPIEADRWQYPYAQLDVTDAEAVQAFADGVGAVDVLVNCAGIGRRDEEFELAMFRRVLEASSRSPSPSRTRRSASA